MKLDKLIEEYKEMTSICHQIDYDDSLSIKLNNRAVDRMYKIVNQIISDFGSDGIKSFTHLLNVKENRTDLWAAVHMLEKMNVDIETEMKALKVVKEEAQNSIGMNYWLMEWKEKRKS